MHTLGHIFKLMSGSALASPYLLRRRILLQNGYWVTKPKKGGIHRLLCRIRMDQQEIGRYSRNTLDICPPGGYLPGTCTKGRK